MEKVTASIKLTGRRMVFLRRKVMPDLSLVRFKQEEKILLNECKRIGPTGINVLNIGRANCATTYSTNFCELVADLLILYRNYSVADPIAKLSENFRLMNIVTCRGADMTYERVKYLVNINVAKLDKNIK